MIQDYYFSYLVEYGVDAPQFKMALKDADVKILQLAAKTCTQTNLKRIDAELRRRERDAYKPIYETIQEYIRVKFPIKRDVYDRTWQQGARDFICGLTLLSCADHLNEVTDDLYEFFTMLLKEVKNIVSDKQQLGKFISKKRRKDLKTLPNGLIDEVWRTYGKTWDAYFEEVKRYLNVA